MTTTCTKERQTMHNSEYMFDNTGLREIKEMSLHARSIFPLTQASLVMASFRSFLANAEAAESTRTTRTNVICLLDWSDGHFLQRQGSGHDGGRKMGLPGFGPARRFQVHRRNSFCGHEPGAGPGERSGRFLDGAAAARSRQQVCRTRLDHYKDAAPGNSAGAHPAPSRRLAATCRWSDWA